MVIEDPVVKFEVDVDRLLSLDEGIEFRYNPRITDTTIIGITAIARTLPVATKSRVNAPW